MQRIGKQTTNDRAAGLASVSELTRDHQTRLVGVPGPRAISRSTSTIEAAVAGLSARINRDKGVDTAFILVNGVLAGLALVLVLIAATPGGNRWGG